MYVCINWLEFAAAIQMYVYPHFHVCGQAV